jgi:TPR repeat protein
MTVVLAVLLAAMSPSDAVAHLLNAPTSCGKKVYAEAKEVVARDAKAGKPLQQFVWGLSLMTDDPKTSQACLDASRAKIREMAEKTNNPMAWYLLSVEKNDVACLQKAADGGNVQALNALGLLIHSEALARRNADTNQLEAAFKRSFRLFHKASRQRDSNGFVNLGSCFTYGLGCAQDLKAAFRCYEAAAALGHPEAMDALSAAYQLGHGVEADSRQSLLWAMRARALRGDRAAEKWLDSQRGVRGSL